MSDRLKFILLFLILLIFRTAYGLSLKFWTPDELQTYLIGLKWYSTHAWPFFGPDLVVDDTNYYAQLPGSLEGLAVGTPFFILSIPEAPFLFLNLLSLSAIALLSAYISKRVPQIPFLFIFAWIALLPWTLNDGTHMYNPCYLLFGSVFFFVGFLEAVPNYTLRWIKAPWAFAFMGFGLLWDMQFHFSWILLVPFVLYAFFQQWWKLGGKGVLKGTGSFLAGAAVPGAFLLITLFSYGWKYLFAGGGTFQFINWLNVLQAVQILAKYLSLACFEMPQFIGEHTQDRIATLNQAPWLWLPAVFLLLVGWAQPFAMLTLGWKKDRLHPEAKPIYHLTWIIFGLLYLSFWFTYKAPVAHAMVVLFPLVTVFSFYIWSKLAVDKRWRLLGKVCLAFSLLFHLGFMIEMIPQRSLYTDREKVMKAIQQKDYHLLGDRKPKALY